MGKLVDRISEIRATMARGPTALLQYLSATRWPAAEQLDPQLDFTSEIIKMMAVLEAIFEEARRCIAPEMPSRLAAIFAWPTMALAERFKAEYLPTGTLHRCRVLEGAVIQRDGGLLPPGIDLQATSTQAFERELDATRRRAETYWRGNKPLDFPELLITGAVTTIATC